MFQAVEEISQHLSTMKTMLCGTGDQEPQTEITASLAQEVYNSNLLEQLIINLVKIDFEVSIT